MANYTSSSFCFLLLFLVPVVILSAKATACPAIFIFGDSILDVGTNNFLADTDISGKANYRYNGIDFHNSIPTGRFSNGYNTADMLVKHLGLEKSPPSFLSLLNQTGSFKQKILQGVNFASGGSGIFDSTGFLAFNHVIPLSQQIQQFSTVRGNLSELLGENDTASTLERSLFLISAGSNDIFDYQRNRSGSINGTVTNVTASELVSALMSTYQNHLLNLYGMGARKFGIISIPPLGCCPFELVIGETGECIPELNELSRGFFNATNTLLQMVTSVSPGMKYSLGNSHDIIMDVIENPPLYRIKEVKKACCGKGNYNAEALCNETANLCQFRNDYLFWDRFHPTEAGAKLAAQALYGGPDRLVIPMNISQLMEIN